jgi:hypothetical protein
MSHNREYLIRFDEGFRAGTQKPAGLQKARQVCFCRMKIVEQAPVVLDLVRLETVPARGATHDTTVLCLYLGISRRAL